MPFNIFVFIYKQLQLSSCLASWFFCWKTWCKQIRLWIWRKTIKKIRQVIFKKRPLQANQLLVKILFDVMFKYYKKLIYVWYVFSRISTYKTWKMIYTNSWCFCQCAILTVIRKIWYTYYTSYIIQTIIAHQHSAPNIDLLKYAGLSNQDKPEHFYAMLLNMGKRLGNSK